MVTCTATLDVPRHIVVHLARLLAAHRRRLGTPRGSRALGTFRQAVLVLRWFRERGCVHCPARDAGISQATSYRYLHEGIDILAARLHVLPTLADKGYIGAGIGIRVPVRRPEGKSEQALDTDTRATNCLVRDLRARGERTAAELKERRRTLKRVTLSPSRISDIARAALALNRHWK
ncbi:transposase family protein [Streptomyces sp. NPDC056948]|uniref:transposase family protein n=1 Tax=Streptomyces sp. NPDC056948 TaxID=3345975 RepID=UPI00363B06E7